MIYIGILVNKTEYIEVKKEDIKYFAGLVGVVCILALIVNNIFDSNLMFISQNFNIAPIEMLYKITNGTVLFSFIMSVGQMTIPFYLTYYIIKLKNYSISSIKSLKSITN